MVEIPTPFLCVVRADFFFVIHTCVWRLYRVQYLKEVRYLSGAVFCPSSMLVKDCNLLLVRV